jgi:hypothetical protein
MYRGAVKEFFLTAGGTLAYVVLQNCSRFYMTFADTSPQTTQQLRLGESQGSRLSNWAYLMIEGENIANILFELSPKIIETKAGNAALESALNQLESGGSWKSYAALNPIRLGTYALVKYEMSPNEAAFTAKMGWSVSAGEVCPAAVPALRNPLRCACLALLSQGLSF